MKKAIVIVMVLALVAGLGSWYYVSAASRPASFRTVTVERGDLLTTINATGTIEPEEVIDVGAQVAGQILAFGEDPRDSSKPINYGTPVEKDTVLARIDDSLYKAQVARAKAQVEQARAAHEQAKAGVAQAEANITKAEADVVQMEAKVVQTDRDLERARRLKPSRSIADSEYDTTESAARVAKATQSVGQAVVVQAKAALKDAEANVAKAAATLADAEANLNNAQINLGYCTIKSPVKGVIVDRRVNVGQTVVSSLNAPSLFLIAKDLKRLQVWASVNEADIGNIFSGQNVTFTVDAYPGRVFKGVVAPDQPRLNASMTQNVVTYTVVVNTDNSDGKLVPYLTANLSFEVAKHKNVLMVANTALRYKPTNPEQVVPEARDEFRNKQRAKAAARAEGSDKASNEPSKHHKGTLWVEDNGLLRPIKVTTGLSDGLMTEIVEGDIEEGALIVTGENKAGAGGGASNPFAPKMFSGGKKQ